MTKLPSLYRILTIGALTAMIPVRAHATVTLLDKDEWKASIGGFVEFDAIHDSTRSLVETVGNSPVDRPDVVNGQLGRTQFSVRNSRFAVNVEAPKYDDWKPRGYLEMDFLGFDSAPPAQSEAAYFNNPTMRIRHAFLSAESDGWLLMAGQYWAFLGWQPNYFMPTAQVAPVPGMLYSRTAQLRAVKTWDMEGDNKLQAGLGVMRPPQRDSEYPGLEGGLRYVMGSRTSGFTGGATGAQVPQPMSIAVSGTVREFAVPSNIAAPTSDQTHYLGSGFAADLLLPILASSDNKDVSNTLTLGAEFTIGKGDGDQFNSWTANESNPTSSAAAAPYKNVNLDAGIGGFDAANNFFLLDVKTFDAYLQYHLPAATRTWFSAGYGWLDSDNASNLAGLTKVAYNREEVYFGNVFHSFTPNIRGAVEYAHIKTTYVDSVVAGDNRFQVSAWFIF